jgi:hypothetical protein
MLSLPPFWEVAVNRSFEAVTVTDPVHMIQKPEEPEK